MADVTWEAEVTGDAAESFDEIAASAEAAGAAAEDLNRKLRSVDDIKVDLDIAQAEEKLARLKAERDAMAEGSNTTRIDLDIEMAEAKLLLLREQAQETGRSMNLSVSWAVVGWTALVPVLGALAGMAAALGLAFGGVAAVGFLAFHALNDGFGGLTSAAQGFRAELTELQIRVLQPLAAAAQNGIFPPITEALKALEEPLRGLAPQIQQLASLMGEGFAGALKIVAELAPTFLQFSQAVMEGLSRLGPVMQTFDDALTTMMQGLVQSGDAQKAMAGLAQILGALLPLLPPLIDAAVKLSAAFGPAFADEITVMVKVLTVLLNIISAAPNLFGDLLGVIIPVVAAMKAWELAVKALGAVQGVLVALGLAAGEGASGFVMLDAATGEATATLVAFDAAAEANPFGLMVMGIVALIAVIYELATHWDQVVAGIEEGAKAIGGFFYDIGKGIVDFFNMIYEAVMAPFKAIGSAFSSLGNVASSLSGLPTFADGGIVTRPTLGVFGEAGPEAIIPLSSPTAQNALGGGGGGDTYNFNISGVVGPPAAVTAAVRTALRTTSARGHGYGFA